MENKKTYLIAGASSGIGLEIALQLKAAGHTILAMSRSKKTLEEHTDITFLEHDFMSDAALPEIPNAIDGLVYCPGSITLKPLRALKDDDLLNDFRINVVGAFKFVNAYSANLKNSDSGSIVLFSSVAAQTGMPFHASVAASKAAVEGLTKALAAELAPKIRVNCIAPSLTDTPLASQLLNSDAKRLANAERHPLKAIGEARIIAKSAVHLLVDAVWTTGQIIGVNGGLGTIFK
ncbi:MAG: SDR family oxidoreductase [Flavobacterium sp.]|uniref:SDR family NAD(P)-dependent oxidoreductase n=1 Tax=Flavobacterium sp. TaxID=239 RepID=UPI001229C8B5|nr:SDR family oxidoreductase [Flavobacterium sp.]RZJ66248.1 MAG: SDR family oxidoreductase [Flavobacterium sp.]